MKEKNNKMDYRDCTYDRLLINRGDVEIICEEYMKENGKNNLIYQVTTLLSGAVLSYTVTVIYGHVQGNTPNNIPTHIIIIAVFAAIIGLSVMIYSFTRRKGDLLAEIYNNVLEKSDHTAIFLISKNVSKDKSIKNVQLLTCQHGTGGETFLVYSKISDKKNFDVDELKKALAKQLSITKDSIIALEHKGSHRSIKRISNMGDEKLIAYEFFSVEIKKSVEREINQNLQYKWKSIDELLKDVPSQIYNHDVIQYIKDDISNELEDSFISKSAFSPKKIIWNITDKCNFKCEICATYDPKRREITLEQKAKALLSLLSIGKDSISCIDFSGGDPLQDSSSRQIIKYAIQEIGNEKVSITTTGSGMSVARDEGEQLNVLLRNCEVTIENVGEAKTIRGVGKYSIDNDYSITKCKDEISALTINVPIVDPDMPEETIRDLVDNISRIDIDNKTVTLIKLMNVGKMAKGDYPPNYDPSKFIRTFLERASSKGLIVKLQCALRTEFGIDGTKTNPCYCNMLSEKLGIDCAGNVFSCAWGGYITRTGNMSIEDNPFYLGNLLDNDLKEILQGKKAHNINAKMERKRKSNKKYCPVCQEASHGSGAGVKS